MFGELCWNEAVGNEEWHTQCSPISVEPHFIPTLLTLPPSRDLSVNAGAPHRFGDCATVANGKNFFIQMFCTIGSPILKWNKFLVWLLLNRKVSVRRSWREFAPALTHFLIITVCPSTVSTDFQSQAHDFDAPSCLNAVYHFSRLFTLCYC